MPRVGQRQLRFRGKHVFLTYPQCNLPLQDVYDELNTKLRSSHNGIKNYIVAHELHRDGSEHRHVWLELNFAPEHVPIDYFNVGGFHGNYQVMKFEDNCLKYVIKGGEYISSFTEEQIKAREGNARSKELSNKIDKNQIATKLFNGEPLVDVVKEYPALLWDMGKLRDNMILFKQLSSTSTNLPELQNEWIWGPTGSGKSKTCNEKYPNAWKHPREIFWDSYEFQEDVLLEDVDETWEDVLWELKIWGDHYPFEGRIKHKPSLKMRPKRIIVTSNYTIQEVMERVFKRKGIKHDQMLINALQRRFKETKLDKELDIQQEFNHIFPNVDSYFARPEDNLFNFDFAL